LDLPRINVSRETLLLSEN